MVAGRRRRELGNLPLPQSKLAGLDDHPAHGGAVAADVLGGECTTMSAPHSIGRHR